VLDFLAYQFTVLTPLIIYFISELLKVHPANITTWSIIWIILTPVLRFFRSLFDAHGGYKLTVIGCDVSNCVALGMVNKSLRFSTLCNKKFKLGEISSLMQVDCFRLSLYPKSFNGIIFIIYVLLFALAFMGVLVHYSFAAGLLVLIIASIVNMSISKCTASYQKDLAIATDNRMKITNEIFNNIKFVKVNAWEEYFYDKVIYRRDEEVKWYHKKFLTEAYATYSMWFFPKMILLATFGTYVATGGSLEPPVVFAIMNMFGYIQFYLQFLPNYISIVIECNNAVKRIQAYLLAE
jgi:ABC-type multidrug transport system fused ATPase/permease subunit